jgi:hypothetical protein
MSSYTAQDPSAYYNKSSGSGLWADQGAMATPYLYTPGSSMGTGAPSASSTTPLLSSVTTPTGVTNATASGLSAAASPTSQAAASYAAPSSAKYALGGALGYSPTQGIALPNGTQASIAGGVTARAGQVASAYSPAQPVVQIWNRKTGSYNNYVWNAATHTYQPAVGDVDLSHARVAGVDQTIAQIQQEADAATAARNATITADQQQNASMAAAQQAAQHPVALPGTAQGSNFDFGSAFSQTPQADAAMASAQSAQNSLGSQLSTNSYQSGNIAAAGRYGAAQEVNTSGQNQLAIQGAQAADTDQNFAALGNAMQAASANASNTTAAQANADVSAIQDDVAALSSQLSTLDGATRAKAQSQLTALQDQINRYQQAVAQAGADSSLAKSIFTGILAAGAAIAVVATGGTAAVAAGAATAASAAGKAA